MTDSNYVRKVGSSEETVESKYTKEELDLLKEEAMNVLDQQDEIRESVANFKAKAKTQMEVLKNRLSTIRRATKGTKREKVAVDLYLTKGNEVFRVIRDTGEVVGRRTATPNELQESLFPESPDPSTANPDNPDGQPSDPPEEIAEDDEEDEEGMEDDPDEDWEGTHGRG